jgi:hypothetical protein
MHPISAEYGLRLITFKAKPKVLQQHLAQVLAKLKEVTFGIKRSALGLRRAKVTIPVSKPAT